MRNCFLFFPLLFVPAFSVWAADKPKTEPAKVRPAGPANNLRNQLAPEELKKLAAEVLEKGDPARGERVARRPELMCMFCHSIGGVGGNFGPNLSAIGKSAAVEHLIEAVLVPDKEIAKGFENVTVVTAKGQIIRGTLVRQDDKGVVVRPPLGGEITIPSDEVESQQKDGGSSMPAGLADSLSREEFLDLICFLSKLGTPGPYTVSDAPVVRRWKVLVAAPESLTALTDPKDFKQIVAKNPKLRWASAHSLIPGDLPLSDLPKAKTKPISFVRCGIEVTGPGKVRLCLNSVKGLTLWVDDDPVSLTDECELQFDNGVHVLTCRIDHEARANEGLRLEFQEGKDSPAQFRLAGK